MIPWSLPKKSGGDILQRSQFRQDFLFWEQAKNRLHGIGFRYHIEGAESAER